MRMLIYLESFTEAVLNKAQNIKLKKPFLLIILKYNCNIIFHVVY